MLTSVQQFGRDATIDGYGSITGGTSLPAMVFTHNTNLANVFFEEHWTSTAPSWGSAGFTWVGDFDGDGRDDIATASSGTIWVKRSTGTSFVQEVWTTTAPNWGAAGFTWVGDFNGDGKDDIATASGGTIWVKRSTGYSFVQEVWTTTASSWGAAIYTFAADFNGDGKTDIATAIGGTIYVKRSTGYSFVQEVWTTTAPNWGSYWTWVGDFNGDGKADIAAASYGTIWVKRSTGTAFVEEVWTTTAPNWGAAASTWVGDYDGDGKADIATASGGTIWVKHSTGSSFIEEVWTTTAPNWGGYWTWTADFDGDGRTDIATASYGTIWVKHSTGSSFIQEVWTTEAPTWSSADFTRAGDFDGDGRADVATMSYGNIWVKHSAGKRSGGWGGVVVLGAPDLVRTVANGAGATTAVTYTPSSAWANTNNPPVTQTVSSLTVGDGRTAAATTQFTYQGGLYDAIERRFMGFRYAKTIQPCITGESACPYTEAYFAQSYGSVSKPQYVYHRDGTGKVLSYTTYSYTTNGATVPYTCLESAQWEYAYDASSAYKRSAVGRAYDAYGNITIEYLYGDYAVSGDEKTIRYQYYPNLTTYVVGKPAAMDTFAGLGTGGALLTQALFYYDGNTTWDAAPTAGKGTKTASWVDTTNTYVTKTVEYDTWGNVTAEIDELGNRVSFTIDPTYHLYVTGITNAQGQTATAAWDTVCGVRTSSVDLNGQTTLASYDNLCRPTLTSLPGGGFESRSYVNLGNPNYQYVEVQTPAADASGNLWTRAYLDGLGRTWRTEIKGPSASKTIHNVVVYDARGNTWKQSLPYYADEAAHYSQTDYDALDRPIKVTHPDGKTETYAYGLGLVTSIDELGNQQVKRTNAWGQTVEQRELAAGVWHTTYYVYNPRGHLTQITDPVSNQWFFTHDSLGRRIQASDPDTGTWTYEYDAASRQVAQVDAKGQRTEFTYDAIGRRQTKTSAAGTPAATTVTWQYDQAQPGYFNAGKLTTVTDPSGAATYDYDEAGLLVRGTRTIGSQSFTFTKGYDASGRLKWTSYPDGDSMGTPASPLVYDGAGRLTGIPGIVTGATYNAGGMLIQHTNANGTVTTKARSATRGWLTSVNTVRGATTLQNLVYSRDAAGRITSVSSPFAYEGWDYGYDELNRLTSATNHGNAALNQTFAYDAIGNMTSNSGVGAYGYAAAGQARPHAVTTAGTNQFAYDANGNMVSSTGRTIEWDADNRPIAINSTTYSYDAEGARLTKTAGGVTTYYVGDDYEVTEGLVTKYITLAGATVAKRVGSVTSWIHTDHQGTIQVITDASGNEVQRLKHRAYGERFETATSHAESRGYTGKRLEDSGLIYLHARYYDPVIGRFISPDPTSPSARTIGLNRYAYAANNPITFTDVDGLGLFKKIKKAFKKLGKAITKVVNAVSKVPVIGGMLRVGVITALGPLYGVATGDWKGMVRAHATALIMVVAYVLAPAVPVAGKAALGDYVGYVAGSAGVGFGSGAGIAAVNGASPREALMAGMRGAAMSGGMAALRSFYQYTVAMSPSDYAQKAGHTFGTNLDSGWLREGSGLSLWLEKHIPFGKAISGEHDWFVDTLDYVEGPLSWEIDGGFHPGMGLATALEGAPLVGAPLGQVLNLGSMPIAAAITWGAAASPFSSLIVGQQTLANDYRRSARSVSSTGWLGNASGQPFGLAPAH